MRTPRRPAYVAALALALAACGAPGPGPFVGTYEGTTGAAPSSVLVLGGGASDVRFSWSVPGLWTCGLEASRDDTRATLDRPQRCTAEGGAVLDLVSGAASLDGAALALDATLRVSSGTVGTFGPGDLVTASFRGTRR